MDTSALDFTKEFQKKDTNKKQKNCIFFHSWKILTGVSKSENYQGFCI
jgi:hypothetical protein